MRFANEKKLSQRKRIRRVWEAFSLIRRIKLTLHSTLTASCALPHMPLYRFNYEKKFNSAVRMFLDKNGI
jgi:hypothetical protein